MARLSDDIEAFILSMLEASSQVELQRNLLAVRFSCSPSQINYVLSTRFSPEQGYYVESRRGGNGFVRIARVNQARESALKSAAASLDAPLSFARAHAILHTLYESKLLTLCQAKLMLSAVAEGSIGNNESACFLRAKILQNMLICAAKEAEENAMQ